MPVVYETPQGSGQPDLLREQEGIQPPEEDNAIASSISMMDNAEVIRLRFLTNQLLREGGIHYGSPQPISGPTPRVPDEFDNAKYEQIACAGLKPRYNGSATELVPTLTLIHIHHQNEALYPATLLPQVDGTMIDLVQKFSKVKTTDVKARAKQIWESDTSAVDPLRSGTLTYYARRITGQPSSHQLNRRERYFPQRSCSTHFNPTPMYQDSNLPTICVKMAP
jgi:hypothetical protein